MSTKLIVFGLVAACAAAWGQSTAQINGTVRDSTGLAVADAALKATQTATGAVRAVTSGSDGAYTLRKPRDRTLSSGGHQGRVQQVRAVRDCLAGG